MISGILVICVPYAISHLLYAVFVLELNNVDFLFFKVLSSPVVYLSCFYQRQTPQGYRFFLTITDDYSRATLLTHKSNAFPILKAFVTFVEKQFAITVKVIRSDNALEFPGTHATQFCQSKGIHHQTSCLYFSNKMGFLRGNINISLK